MRRRRMSVRSDAFVFCTLPLFTACVLIWMFVVCAFSVCLVKDCLAQLAETPWPTGLHDLQHSGCSPVKASQTNEVCWKFQAEDTIWSSPALGVDGTIYIGAHDGKLYAISSDGSLKWSYQTGKKIISSPSISADGTIYIGSYDYYFYAIKPDG
ncbi:MAG: PQQ-like beta-propeller repeat protein, partial [Planctomycetes bacterium]|nr:PQQ-like beta-propeller repeat protein [Planctomycetota bacterium]